MEPLTFDAPGFKYDNNQLSSRYGWILYQIQTCFMQFYSLSEILDEITLLFFIIGVICLS